MGVFDFLSNKSSNERTVEKLIQTVRSDPKGRYEALVSLKKIGDSKAIDTFCERLNDPSPKIRRISIEALGEMGNASAISSLANLINTNDFSPYGKKTNFGHPENIELAKQAIRKIQQRSPFNSSPPSNDGQNWTDEEIQLLRQSWDEGKFIQIMAKQLERSPDAIVHKLIDTGLIGYNDDNCYPRPDRHGLTWSDQERTQLISELNAGKSITEIAKIHQRNKNSIFHMMVKLKTFNYMDRGLLEKYTENNVPLDNNKLICSLISELENNSNIDLRKSAATQLGFFHEPSVVNALIKSVKNDPDVRYIALAALRNLGDPLAIPIFIERSKDPSTRIRLVSVKALGEIGDSSVIKHLESLIKSKDYQDTLKYGGNPEIIQVARDAIQKIRSKDRSGEPQPDRPDDSSDTRVLSSIQEIDERIKKGLAREIVAKGELPFIINCTRHSHNDIRKHANWALGNLALNGEAEQVVQAGAVPILIGVLSDPYEWARSSSAWALSALAEKGQAQNLVKMGVIQPLIAGLKDSDNLVRGCSARAIDKIAFAGFANDLVILNSVPPLVHNLEDNYDNVRKKSIWALWSIAVKGKAEIFGQDSFLKPLIKYVLDKDVEVRSGSLHLLGVLAKKGLSERILGAGITPPLIKSLSSRSRRVRGAAAWALGEIDQGITGDEFIQSGAIAELEKISDNSNKILIFDETNSSWVDKSIHEIVEHTICIIKQSAKKPELTLTLDHTQLIADDWDRMTIQISNRGNAHAKDVRLTFSDEFDTKWIKPATIDAGATTPLEIGIRPKLKGKIPLEVAAIFRDGNGKEYRKTHEFWIDVVEKGKITSVGQSPPKLISSQDPQIIRAYEFYAGYIRLKISIKNPTLLTIHNVILEPDIDRAILYLDRHEPEEYPSENEKIILGTINPNNDRTVSLYLEPIICAKEGTDVQCHVRYKDAQGKPGSIDMEPLRIQVVCPIFETKEPVNIGSLKQLIESLPSRDTKIFSVPRNLDAPTQLKLFQSVIQLHDIRHISTLRRANNFESWYYGRTKVSQKDMVIKLGIAKDMDMVEITAFSYDPKDLTGLLSEINRHVTEEVSKRGNVQKIFNISIKDSVVQRTNLMSFCDADGKCSGDVTISDSVVMRSNIG